MTVPAWPSDLPRPTRRGYGRTAQDSRSRRRADVGPPAFRRRFSSAAQDLSLSIRVHLDQKARFERFLLEDTAGGSLPFYMPDPARDGAPLLAADGQQLLDDTGAPILIGARMLCLFGDKMPSESVIGLRFEIGFAVWVLP